MAKRIPPIAPVVPPGQQLDPSEIPTAIPVAPVVSEPGDDDPDIPTGIPLGPGGEGVPFTAYFSAKYQVQRGRNWTPCYATIRVEANTRMALDDIVAVAEEIAAQYAGEGDSCSGGVLEDLTLTAPAYYQYSQGML